MPKRSTGHSSEPSITRTRTELNWIPHRQNGSKRERLESISSAVPKGGVINICRIGRPWLVGPATSWEEQFVR